MDLSSAGSERAEEPCEIGRIGSNPDVYVLGEIGGTVNDRRLATNQQILDTLAFKALEKFAHRGPRWDRATDRAAARTAAAARPESTLPIPPKTAREMSCRLSRGAAVSVQPFVVPHGDCNGIPLSPQ